MGFQTRLRIPEQQRVFRMIPGLETRSFCGTAASIGTHTSTVPPASDPGSLHGTTAGSSSRDRSLASRGTPSRSAPGSWPESTSRARSTALPVAPSPYHDARRPLSLPARGRSEALPADERQLRSTGSPAGKGKERSKKELLVERAQADFAEWLGESEIVLVELWQSAPQRHETRIHAAPSIQITFHKRHRKAPCKPTSLCK